MNLRANIAMFSAIMHNMVAIKYVCARVCVHVCGVEHVKDYMYMYISCAFWASITTLFGCNIMTVM